MGPSEGIDKTCRRNNGPTRMKWQLPLHVLWAHPRALTAPAEEIMGPSKSIGSCCCKCYGPIWGHQQDLSKKKRAQANQLAASIVNTMGPSESINDNCQKYSRPKRVYRQHLFRLYWLAHLLFLSTFTQWAHVGFSEFSGQIAHGFYRLLRQRSVTLCGPTLLPTDVAVSATLSTLLV